MRGPAMPSHMRREVDEIPAAAARFLARSGGAAERLGLAMRQADPALIVTVARGSSDHAATFLKYAVEIAAGVPVASVGPSIASIYRRELRLHGTFCFAISQSGRSPDLVATMRSAAAGGAATVAVTNAPESPLAHASAFVLDIAAGPERSVAATKTFALSVLAILAVLAEWRDDEDLRAAVQRAPDACAAALACDWSPLAERLAEARALYVLGRGPGYAMAGEMALKFKETCGLQAESYSAAEVLHGPAALVGNGFPVLALGLDDAALPSVVETAGRLAAQGADVFLTAPSDDPRFHVLPGVPGLHPLVAPLATIVTFYRFVEALARRRGLDPDAPPHLRKVTETR